MRHAQLLNQPLLVTQRTQRRHEPTIPISPLPHVISRRALNVKLRLVKYLHDAFGAPRPKVLSRVVEGLKIGERLQAITTTELQVGLEVKVRIPVPFVDSAALLDNLFDLGPAHSCRGFVRCLSGC